MDEPGWSWPAWKFGMRRDDLFTKLHDQYNTFPSSIQDPEAFHHDVFEISNHASSVDEFHKMMADRKQQRLHELNNSLESAAVEIIANPNLIGTEQWQYALQLFRTKSLDSLVRYFASYLPDDHPWHRADTESITSESTSEGVESLTNSATFFIDHDDKPILTREPVAMSASIEQHLPPSPHSLSMHSDVSVPPSADRLPHAFPHNIPTPARTLSFSGSEPETFNKSLAASQSLEDEVTSQLSDPESPITSVSDVSEGGFVHVDENVYCVVNDAHHGPQIVDTTSVGEDHSATDVAVLDYAESATTTPKPEQASSYIDLHRQSVSIFAQSPSETIEHNHCSTAASISSQDARKSPRMRSRREGSPTHIRRRSPGGLIGRIQKPLPDPIRCRPRGRRRVESAMLQGENAWTGVHM